MNVHPESHHAHLRRRVNRLFFLVDVLKDERHWPELRRKLEELRKLEDKKLTITLCTHSQRTSTRDRNLSGQTAEADTQ